MRAEKEMFKQILDFGKNDDRIKLIFLEGSRTNINIPKDEFQDYDITFLVTDMESFKKSDEWLKYFGECLIMQKPEDMELYPPELEGWFSYLMQFEDGIKIDLTLVPINELNNYLKKSDGLVEILMDKDNLIKEEIIGTDEKYHIKKPTEKMFDDCCNEYWWLTIYVSKGLSREEILFSNYHFNVLMNKNLMLMTEWLVGTKTNFSLSTGKNGKFLKKYLSKENWEALMKTFNTTNYKESWNSLFIMNNLFKEISKEVSKKLNYKYPNYNEKITPYLEKLFDKYLRNGN